MNQEEKPREGEALKKLVYISVFGNILSVILVLLGSVATDIRYMITVTLYIVIIIAIFPYQWIAYFLDYLHKRRSEK